jgi:large subunit ribosomal protein L13
MKIDAKDQPMGRLATEIARVLQGKHKPDFSPEKEGTETVEVENIREMKLSGRKIQQKVYWRHTGYPGGIKNTPLKKIMENNPGEALKKAVMGMLPKNKLRDKRIKRLIIKK